LDLSNPGGLDGRESKYLVSGGKNLPQNKKVKG